MDDPSGLITLAVERLVAAGIRQRGALAKRLEATTTDILALHYVVRAPASTPGDLARALLVSPSGATAVIDRLSRAGLISRAHGSGRHRVALTATEAGRELHGQALTTMRDDIRGLVDDLPRDHRIVLERFLARLADLAEREANLLIARAEADARAAVATPPPVLWS